jgi:U4/U6.U5 tri-snRNP component SNU23
MSARRTWDKEYFEQRAKDRLEYGDDYVDGEDSNKLNKKSIVKEEFRPAEEGASGPMGSERAFLKSRESKLELEEKVGKIEIINPLAADGNKAGYWCEVCKCLLKDSASYLDHINGKKRK